MIMLIDCRRGTTHRGEGSERTFVAGAKLRMMLAELILLTCAALTAMKRRIDSKVRSAVEEECRGGMLW